MANYDVEPHTQTNKQTHIVYIQKNVLFCFFLAPYARTTRYEEAFLPEAFLPEDKKRPHYYLSLLFVTQIQGHVWYQALSPLSTIRFVPFNLFVARILQLASQPFFLPSPPRVEYSMPGTMAATGRYHQ